MNFKHAQDRNKLVLHRDVIHQIESVDVGLLLAQIIYALPAGSNLSLRVWKQLKASLNDKYRFHQDYGRFLALKNPGILFEPELNLDVTALLADLSRNELLFLQWDGEIERDTLYFLSREHGIKLSIKHISHIIL